MRAGLVFAVLGAGVSLVEARRPPFLDECSVENVLRYFTCKRHIPESCVSELEQQAAAFCSSYISVPTTTVTVTLDLNTATVNVPTSTTEVVVPRFERDARTASASATSCASLATKGLIHHPASRLTRACSCLGIEPTPSTVTVTLEATSTRSTTATSTTTSTTSTTSTPTATTRPVIDCANPALFSRSTSLIDLTYHFAPAGSVQECCEQCLGTTGCVAGVWNTVGVCATYMWMPPPETAPLGGWVSDVCPFGVQPTFKLSNPDPNVHGLFPGPCLA